jgi:glycosyltransferase involved in cell wall biosynthesis
MIVFVHLLNDRSGSPRVLASTILALTDSQTESQLFIGSGGSGILDETKIRTTRYWYRRTPYRILTLATFFASQISLLYSLFRAKNIDKDAVIYVNTLLPFGAALFGWMTGRIVIYHLHELSISPRLFQNFLKSIARLTAKKLIYVSNYHKAHLVIQGIHSRVVYNSIDESIFEQAKKHHYEYRRGGLFNVLMLASLRDYKGVPEFVALAARLSKRDDISFDLVVNDDKDAIHRYFRSTTLSSNLRVHPKTNNPGTFYTQSSLVLNLSRTDQWVETFGLTLLEAMVFGIPVIAPPIGGPVEFIEDGIQGYLVDSRDSNRLDELILLLAKDPELCESLSKAGRCRAKKFSPENFAVTLRKEVLGWITPNDQEDE